MKIAVVGAKSVNDSDATDRVTEMLKAKNIIVDRTYFDTTLDEDNSNLQETYKREKKLITNNDCLIIDVTVFSTGFGYFIADAINNRKPVLAIHNIQKNPEPSVVIKSSQYSKLLTYKEFTNENIESVVSKFLEGAQKNLETKYILLLPAEIDQYLEWASYTYHMPKSQIVRDAIQAKMKLNKEWIKHVRMEE